MKGSKVKSKAKEKTNKILALLTLCTLLITTIIIAQFIVLDNDINKTLQNGTVINGLNLSGMSKDEASQILIQDFTEKANDFNLTITHPETKQSWAFNKSDFDINSDIHTILEASQDRDNLLNNNETTATLISQFHKEGGSINVAFNYMFVGLDEKIETILNEVEKPPVNSEITFNPNKSKPFDITESINGLRVDKNSLYQSINEQFLITNDIKVDLEFIEELPTISKEYNENLTQKIASFTTNVADSTGGRKHNVKEALKQFNGMILEPNKQISFNVSEFWGSFSIWLKYVLFTFSTLVF